MQNNNKNRIDTENNAFQSESSTDSATENNEQIVSCLPPIQYDLDVGEKHEAKEVYDIALKYVKELEAITDNREEKLKYAEQIIEKGILLEAYATTLNADGKSSVIINNNVKSLKTLLEMVETIKNSKKKEENKESSVDRFADLRE